jgi:hypothetical protein
MLNMSKKSKNPTSQADVLRILLNKMELVVTANLTAHVAFGIPYIGDDGVPVMDVFVNGVDGYCCGGFYPLQMRFVSTGNSYYPAHAPAFQFKIQNGVFGMDATPCLSDGSYHQSGDGGNKIQVHPISYVMYSILEVLRDGGASTSGGIAIKTYDCEDSRKRTIGGFADSSKETILRSPSLKDHCRRVLVDSWNIYRRNVVVWDDLFGSSDMEMKRKELSIPARFMTYLDPYPNEDELRQIKLLFTKEYMSFADYWNFLNEIGAVEEINTLAAECRERRRGWLDEWKSSGADGADMDVISKFRRLAWGRGGHEGPLYFPIPKPGEAPEWILPGRGEIIIQPAVKLDEVEIDDFGF